MESLISEVTTELQSRGYDLSILEIGEPECCCTFVVTGDDGRESPEQEYTMVKATEDTEWEISRIEREEPGDRPDIGDTVATVTINDFTTVTLAAILAWDLRRNDKYYAGCQ